MHLVSGHKIIPLRSIPWAAFRHFRGRPSQIDTAYLSNAWTYAFNEARSAIHQLSIIDGSVHIQLKDDSTEVIYEFHRSLLRCFSPHLYHLCGEAMKNFIPSIADRAWDVDIMS